MLLYGSTLHTSVQAADNAELQLVALTFGVAHPPGYPLWSVFAGIFARIPGLPPLTGLALFSLLTSAAAVVLAARTIEVAAARRVTGDVAVTATAMAAAALLATGDTFWVQATTTNIRSATALFAVMLAWAAAHAFRGKPMPATLGLIVGLAAAHHPSLLFPALPITGYVLLRDGRSRLVRSALRFVLLAAAAQIVWLYLPLRDAPGAAFAPGGLRTLQGFLDHALARGFGGDMFWFVFVEPQRLLDRLLLLPMLASFAVGSAAAVLAVIGCAIAAWRRAAFAVVCGGAALLHLFVTLTYRAPQTVEYALPAWMLLGVVGGAGLSSLFDERLRPGVRALPALLIGALAVFQFAIRLPDFVAASRDRTARARAEGSLLAAPRDAVVLSQWHQATPLLLLQRLESLRPDVLVEYVAPNGAQPYAETFAARARAHASRPIVATSCFDAEFAAVGLQAVPLRGVDAWIVEAVAATSSESMRGALFDGRIAVRVDFDAKTIVEPGDMIPIDVSWRAAPGAYVVEGEAVTVRLFRADGRLAANADVQLSVGARRGARRVLLGAPLDLAPGKYALQIGAYRAQDGRVTESKTVDGAAFVSVGEIDVTASAMPIATRRPLAPLGCSDFCIAGVDYDLGLPGRVRLWVHMALGAERRELQVYDAAGNPAAAPCSAPAGRGRYFSCSFDIAPLRGLQLRAGGLTMAAPDYLDGELYVPFGGRMVLIGLHGSRAAEERIVDLRWLAARSLNDDYVVSVRVDGAAHDGIPALGALPTLKWLRGAIIDDRHPVRVIDQSRSGAVVVYDSVSRSDLPVLDERYEGRFTFELSE